MKAYLQSGIERLENPPPPPAAKKSPAKRAAPQSKPAATRKEKTPPPDPEFAPCVFVENSAEGLHSLLFTQFHLADDVFEELGRDGDGYGWHGVVDALVRSKAPQLAKQLDHDPEASMFVALSRDRDTLKAVAALVRTVLENPRALKQAIKKANPKLMD